MKKAVLIICPFDDIFPPMNGGMQRCFHIMHQLAKHFDLTAIIHQDRDSFLKSTTDFPAFSCAKVYSTKFNKNHILNFLPLKIRTALLSRWYQRQWNKPADSSLVKYYPILTSLLAQQKFDVIFIENLATLNAVKIIRRYDRNVKIIYNAHNVDSNLVHAAVVRKEMTSLQLSGYQKTESNFHKLVNAVITCSKDDMQILNTMNKNKLLIDVVPNGVRIPDKMANEAVVFDRPESILFCGSLWSIPNSEGLHWFCEKIWPLIKKKHLNLKLIVVGPGEIAEKYSSIKNTNDLVFAGGVKDVSTFYNKSSIAIVPLLTGSGTRLKVLEAMGHGVPVVSTSIGAEGINYTNEKNILIADNEENFAERIIVLLGDKKQRQDLASAALELARMRYDWNIIGNGLKDFMEHSSSFNKNN